MRQPDGYIVKCRMMGDEFLHWIESEDGYTLLYDENHFLTLAITDDDGNLVASKLIYRNEDDRDIPTRRQMRKVGKHARFSAKQEEGAANSRMLAAEQRRIIKPANPVVGERKFLVVMMEFPDKPFKHTQSEFYALMNEEGYTTDGNCGSVRDFYKENSFGQLDLVSDVAGIYRAKHDMAYYGNNTNGNAQALAIEAMAAAAADYDLKDYDSDGDGFIDGLHIIFSGFGEEAGGGDDCIWAHECRTTGVFCTYDGVKMNAYSCSPELRGSSGTGMSYIGVVCHEIGHALGTPDFYDTNYATGGQYGGSGKWDVMGSGSWNGNGACPAHFNPYTKIYDYKWSSVQDGNRAVCATLNAKTKGDFIRIDTQNDGEYFLLEYRSKTSFDSYIPGHGLMVWRATDNLSRRNANTINAYHKQQFYPMAANSTTDIPTSTPSTYGNTNSASTPFPGTNGVTELTDETKPSMKSWEGVPTEYPITNIVEHTANGYVTFDIAGGDYGTAYGLEIGNATLNSLTATWQTPQEEMLVMLLCNAEDTFGTPEDRAYTVGETLDGGGDVIYVGTANEFTHAGLMEHTTYCYRICTWMEATQTWAVSSTHTGRTKTGIITTFPYVDNFNTPPLDEVYEEEIVFGTSNRWSIEHPTPDASEWNLIFIPDGFTHQQSRLLLPLMDFNGARCAFLSFDYRNWIISGKVMYRTSPETEWQVLYEMDSHFRVVSAVSGENRNSVFLNSETHVDIPLPDLTSTYQLCLVGDFSPRGNSMNSTERLTVRNLKVTVDNPTIVSTISIGAVGATSAVVRFSALAGTATLTETGVAYSTDKTTWTKVTAPPTTCQLTGLARNTIYYTRAYARDTNGNDYYGDTQSFKTLSFTSGSGTKDDPILINSLTDWNQLRSVVAGGNNCEGSHFALTTSLTLSSSNMIKGTFNGILDGRNYTLSSSTQGIVDYFIQVLGNKGEICHLTLTTGPLVTTNYGIIHDCRVNFAQSYSNSGDINSFGFIAGRNYNVIYSCHVYAQSFYHERGYIGGICGWNYKQVYKCSFDGNLSVNNNASVGGITASNYHSDSEYGVISQCINNGTIGVKLNSEGRAWWTEVGGIAGSSYGTIDQCVNRGTVTTGCSSNVYDNSNYAGGIVGGLNHNVALVSNCLHEGTVTTSFNLSSHNNNAGGIVGYGYLTNISNSISVGRVVSTTSISSYDHAIIGNNNQTGVEHCFYLNTPADSYATQLTAAQMSAPSLVEEMNDYNGLDVWTTGTSHPTLLMETSDTSLTLADLTDITRTSAKVSGFTIAPEGSTCSLEWKAEGDATWNATETAVGRPFTIALRGLSPATIYVVRLAVETAGGWTYSATKTFATEFESIGTADDPILLPDLYTLRVFRHTVHQGNQYSNQVIRLMADIDLQGNKGVLWEPITEGDNGGFAGEFDGNGHVIRNMKVVSSAPTAGFFGTTHKCYIHDLTILDGSITSNVAPSTNGYLGGVGGILGDNISYADDKRPLVERCSFTGTITGGNAIGGIAGDATSNDIVDCYAVATIHDPRNTTLKGGITSEGNVTNCYFAGRIVNANQPSTNYSVVVGRKSSTTSVVTNSYYENDQLSFAATYGTRLSGADMKNGTLLSKLPSEEWLADNTATPVNNGYPILVSQSAPHVWADYTYVGETLTAKGTFYGAEKNYATRGFEICDNPEGEGAYEVVCQSANTFSYAVHYTPNQYIQFRAFARENESTTVYSDWVIPDGEQSVLQPETKDFTVNGLIYHYDKESPSYTVTVTGHTLSGSNGSLDLVIPETVTDEGVEYTVTDISDAAFDRCAVLRTVSVPSGVKQLKNRVFRQCYYLIAVQLPEGLEAIGTTDFQSAMGTFHQCSGLQSINFPSTLTLIGRGAFSGCTSLKTAELPNSVTTLGSCAFDGCSGLTAVTLSENITQIDLEAFRNCSSLTSVTIPKRVTYIGQNAFANCTNLTSVTVEATSAYSIHSNAFPLRTNATLYVPDGSKASYDAANYWKDFKKIVELKLGDVNGNGGLDIGDAVSIVNYLVGKPSETFIERNADTNDNGGIDIGDAVTIVNILVGKTTSTSQTVIIDGNEREPQ